jgi:hypothetical protein
LPGKSLTRQRVYPITGADNEATAFARAVFAAALFVAGAAMAQPYPPPPDPNMSYRIVGVIPNSADPLSDTRRHSIAATPDCGATNPQGGVPSSVTWGECP